MDDIQMSGTKKKTEKPSVKGVKFFNEGKYKEAIIEFSKYLESNLDDREKKVAHYNRGMAHNFLDQYSGAVQDGEKCIKLDPFWAKGYKCKGLALEGMKKPREAMDVLLNGGKMCDDSDTSILSPIIKRLNKETGYLEGDLDLNDRMSQEKYCLVCNLFENDIKGQARDQNIKFVCCNKCCMVNYCSKLHRDEDTVVHKGVCEQLLRIKKRSEQLRTVHVIWKGLNDKHIFWLVQEIKGPLGKQISHIGQSAPMSSKEKEVFKEVLKHEGCTPLIALGDFSPVSSAECETLKTWEDWFSLPGIVQQFRWEQFDMVDNMMKMFQLQTSPQSDMGNLERDIKEVVTESITDPMSVFYAMKQGGLLTQIGKEVIRLHVVGAEPRIEILIIKGFVRLLISVLGPKLQIILIGPLLTSAAPAADDMVTTFGGTYQEFLLSGLYLKPDCIVAFYPGLYDGTYNWTPAVAHAISKNVPFFITCSSKTDYDKTKLWLEKECRMKPKIILDYLNPFASLEVHHGWPVGSNEIVIRNMFCLLLTGGELGPLGQLVDDKFDTFDRETLKMLATDIFGDVMEKATGVPKECYADIIKLKANDML